MAQTIAIPGRRVSSGETFYTDWVQRGGDCMILRVQVLIAAGGGDAVTFWLETRGDDGTTVTTPVTPTSPSGGLELTAVGVGTCLYLASTTSGGSQEQVRVGVQCGAEGGTGYYVVRIFPIIFFDNAKP
ncbi:MAG: hypothetical protein IT456_12040 [Planctomycetes bacterium]|jgi:hypothetical protein|nr:hypothetical protein [Planctomycetota bacterium]